MEKVLKTFQADFGQCCSQAKLERMLKFPITWSSCLKAFLAPLVLPTLVFSITLIPLGDQKDGLHGRNWNVLLQGLCSAIVTAFAFDARFKTLIPDTRLDRRKRIWCVVVFCSVAAFSAPVLWTYVAFPFPFRTCSS